VNKYPFDRKKQRKKGKKTGKNSNALIPIPNLRIQPINRLPSVDVPGGFDGADGGVVIEDFVGDRVVVLLCGCGDGKGRWRGMFAREGERVEQSDETNRDEEGELEKRKNGSGS
jgi:hypothetical protein